MSAHFIEKAFLLISLFCCASVTFAERYHVTEDSFGSYSAKPVTQEPDIQEEAADEEEPLKKSPPPQITENSTTTPSVISDTDNNISKDESSEQKKSISIFEQKYLEAERKARKKILTNLKKGDGDQAYDATAINEADYVDGDDLLKSGGDLKKEDAPYFIFTDSAGNQVTTFYDPALEKDALLKLRQKKIVFTDANIYKKDEPEGTEATSALPENADPVALQILGAEGRQLESYFDSFSKRCCSKLPSGKIPEIVAGRSYSFSLKQQNLPYRFNEGDSRYLLLRLPEKTENYPFLLRTFIRKYKKLGIEHGVFFPQLITLDASNKRKNRCIKELLFGC